MSEYPELDRMVDGVKARDERAFTAVYDTLAPLMISFAVRMLHDRQAAEDATQQAFLELARSASGFRGDGRSMRAWLFTSLRYSCLDEIRRRERHPEDPTASLPEPAHLPEEAVVPGLDPDMDAALAALTDRQRSLILLKHVAGLDGAEIAAAMGSPRAAVYAATARAERRFRTLMGVESGGDPASQSMRQERR